MALALFCLLLGLGLPRARAATDPAQGPGGPILIVTSGSPSFGTYYAEILRTEGFNYFAVADVGGVTAGTLASYDVVVLAKMPLTTEQVTMFTTWVNGGGNLIAMAPDSKLATLLGVTAAGASLADGYLLVDASTAPGKGIVDQTIQFHGTADRYSLNGATRLATLYSSSTAATSNPAVTLRTVGNGRAAAFMYDLATSIVYTRQGNPAWATQERDGFAPIRSDDKFFGSAAGDTQPDWIDLNKVAIPQADEQQRLLANLILHMNAGKKPLPRWWYFPGGKKAVIVMTGDDHGNGGTVGRFDQYKALSPAGCSVADWTCVRGTSYMFTSTPMSDRQASQYTSEGFEVGLHISTGCANYDLLSLQGIYGQQVPEFQAKYPGAGTLLTQRHHCIAWSDWTSGAQVQLNHGMRLDTSYYFWPPSWVGDVHGLFTGSAMPMRFARLDGSYVDVYQAATQMTDESGQTYPLTVDTLLDRALGAEGYYGAYVVNAHTDLDTSAVSDAVVASALARGVPVVSAQQMLKWLDARSSSDFGAMSFNSGVLTFTVTKDPAARGLQGMLPVSSGTSVLGAITRGGSPVSYTVSTVKGVDYAFFAADTGTYLATYGADSAGPTVSAMTPAPGATNVAVAGAVRATFSEAMSASSIDTSTFELRNASNVLVSAAVSYDEATHVATLTPSSALSPSTTYTATVRGGATDPRVKDAAGNAMAASVSWSFTTGSTADSSGCPCSAWGSSATPSNLAFADPNPVELGVKFRSDLSGSITGIRFYKGTPNTGTHVGNLWSAGGALLASATFTNESASGWQTVNFATPVAITANTVYVASYFAPLGNYAADGNYFANAGVDNAPLHLLRDGVSGGNGVYQYAGASTFPSSSFKATNYWVDVVFSTGSTSDTTAPTVTAVSPPAGATGVVTTSSVTVTFSEAMDAASISTSNIELRSAANVLVASSVSYDAAARRATLTPNAALAASATYTATVRGGATDPRVKDAAGNAMAASVSWSFTTGSAADPSGCPCSAWGSSAMPSSLAFDDSSPVELGVKFRSDLSGSITGIRFYKGTPNTGTHVGNLWSAGGALLASATFTNETASGWQTVNFATPVAIAANTVYVASYFAPNGNYAADGNYFDNAGVDNAPLHFLRDGVSGGNGVYQYAGASTFPSSSFKATNYWVDVVFSTGSTSDTTAPTVTAVSPPAGATDVVTTSSVTVTFSEAMDAASISTSSIELRSAANVLVASSVSYDAAARRATLTPNAALAASATYTATVRGGAAEPRVKDLAGNALAASASWTFTAAAAAGGACPCSAWPGSALPANAAVNDPGSVTLGVKFKSDQSGFITGVRFYKGSGNVGAHVAQLWSSAGSLLASATASGETATGWQQVHFATPVAIDADTVYVASYFAPSGNYAGDNFFFATARVDNAPLHLLQDGESGGNGLYVYGSAPAFPFSTWKSSNYWVDVIFTP